MTRSLEKVISGDLGKKEEEMIQRSLFIPLFFLMSVASAKSDFLSLFKNPKPMIAALMIEKDLGDQKKIDQAILWGKQQIAIAEKQEMDGILFEFRGGKILKPALTEQNYQAMKQVATELVKASQKLVVGVEILWHYPEDTLRLAKDSGAKFVRVDFFTDEVLADKEKVPLNPEKLLSYKKKIGAENVFLLTDIQVKYSEMVDPKISLDFSAKRAISKGSDGVIVTSTKSGTAPSPERPKLAKKGAGNNPVVIGSGFALGNADSLLPFADAVIVGTSISVKTGGPLVPEKVEKLMAKVKQFRQQSKGAKRVQ